jgi:mannose-6-phosphate isomerase
MAKCDYLLRFEPIFRRYLWGGRRLGTVLRKPIGAGEDYAESWEVVDHGADQSVVASGPLKGRFLGDLVREQADELLGLHAGRKQFPLLLKFLDCNRTLSVQVHPNDQQAAKLTPPDLGKTEAWVVLAAEPGSKIYAGLRHGVDRLQVAEALDEGRLEECLHTIEPRVGECLYIPAGTVHALGAGLLVAEIQQASDTTFRLFDWNRVDADGKPRALHVQQGLEAIDFSLGPLEPQSPRAVGGELQRLVDCEKFVLDRMGLSSPEAVGGDERCHLIVVIDGEVEAERSPDGRPLAVGDTALVPAGAGAIESKPRDRAVILDIFER